MSLLSEILADNPVHYWRMKDSPSGSGHIPDQVTTGAVQFSWGDGNETESIVNEVGDASRYVTWMGGTGNVDAPFFFVENPSTVEFWYRGEMADVGHAGLDWGRTEIVQRAASTGGVAQQGFTIGVTTSLNPTKFYFVCYEFVPDSGEFMFHNAGQTVAMFDPTDTHHIALVHDVVTTTLYINGVAQSIEALDDPSADVTYGPDFGITANPSGGWYDEIALYDHALTASRVLAHFNAGTFGDSIPTVRRNVIDRRLNMRSIRVNESSGNQRRVYFHLTTGDGRTVALGEDGGQPQISINGGGWTNTGIGTLTSIGNGRYFAELDQAILTTAGDTIESRYKSVNTMECPGDSVDVVAYKPGDELAVGTVRATAGGLADVQLNDAGLSNDSNAYNGAALVFLSGAAKGQARRISSYGGGVGSKHAALVSGVTVLYGVGDRIAIIGTN